MISYLLQKSKSTQYQKLLMMLCLFFLFLPEWSAAQIFTSSPSVRCAELRKPYYDPIARKVSVEDYENSLRDFLAAEEGQECAPYFIALWASALTTDYLDFTASNRFIDSMLNELQAQEGDPLLQTLQVQYSSNLSDMSQKDDASEALKPLFPLIDLGEVHLIDTNYYFILAAVLTEIEEYDKSTALLTNLVEKMAPRAAYRFRIDLNLLFNLIMTKNYTTAVDFFEEVLPRADTAAFNYRMITAFYALGAEAYFESGEMEKSFQFAMESSALAKENFYVQYVDGALKALRAAQHLEVPNEQHLINIAKKIAYDDTEPDFLQRSAYVVLMEYGNAKKMADW